MTAKRRARLDYVRRYMDVMSVRELAAALSVCTGTIKRDLQTVRSEARKGMPLAA